MKKQLIALLLILSMLLSFASCVEHVPAVDPDDGDTPPSETPPEGDVSDPSAGDGVTFTVTVMFGGSVYIPEKVADDSKTLKVRLTDGKSYHTVNVGENGTAVVKGLDGDYAVTLLNLPEGYTYNPNIYNIGNDDPNITVELLKLTKTDSKKGGTNTYGDSIPLKTTGVYRATIKSEYRGIGSKKEKYIVYFSFTPQKSGSYCIESLMDISAEMFNPMVDIYVGGNVGYNQFIERRDGGGVSGTYTKNFKHVLNVDEEFLGNNYVFGVLVEGKDAVYPTYVDFEISYLGTYEEEWVDSSIIISDFIPGNLNYFDLVTFTTIESLDASLLTESDKNNASYKWYTSYKEYLLSDREKFGDSYIDAAIRTEGKLVFDEDYYRLNPDDGYYHVYDEVKYAEYGGWGPILYADITSPTIFIADPFSTIEYAGNKALTVCEGTENYKMFIEGFYELTLPHGDSGPYFCNSDCKCYKKYDTAKTAWQNALNAYRSAYAKGESMTSHRQALMGALENLKLTNGGSCSVSCTDCKDTCRNTSDDNRFNLGYANIAIDGRCAVTAELMDFLQKYSESQRLFSDGNGWAEQHSPRYDAYEDSQWLFACGYYY